MEELMEPEDMLGKKFRDTITGFEGICTAAILYLNGCTRLQLSGAIAGKPEDFFFDLPQVELVEDKVLHEAHRETGGFASPPRRSL